VPGSKKRMACAVAFLLLACNAGVSQERAAPKSDSYDWNNRAPDPRFKADILLVVAHPDDEVMAGAYLAREVFDYHKRIAIVFQNPGDGGVNELGPEQAASLGAIRQMEARRAAASLGITNVWFLNGHDTYSQNVLTSLEHCGHGGCLDQLVRIVRITRPLIVLTWLPDFATGENHSDHQAAGVLATEAFDLAGDPMAFPEQVSPAMYPDQPQNMTEGLRTWQPQKLYYFYNSTHNESFDGKGPRYSSQEISPSRQVSYGLLAAQENTYHVTQGGERVQKEIDKGNLEASPNEIAKIATGPTRFIFGKSLVPSGVTDDVCAGVKAEGIAYQRPPGYLAMQYAEPALRIGDPWSYYQRLWQAHGLDHISTIIPTEITVHTSSTLYIPLVVENPGNQMIHVSFSVQAPDEWQVMPLAPVQVEPRSQYYVRLRANAPAAKIPGWQNFTVSGKLDGKSIGTVPIRVELSNGWVAPQ
jgi:LmbE family N-acetylglucosaminyl deacetylase